MERWPQFIDKREKVNHREAGIRIDPAFVFKNVSYVCAWRGFASHGLILRNGIRKREWGNVKLLNLTRLHFLQLYLTFIPQIQYWAPGYFSYRDRE